ncbi:MAG: transcription elongation factor GreA [Steroidobacteraceae bacterium]
MSRAFTREQDPDAAAAADILPDRPISAHPNFVTAEGLAAMEETVRQLTVARTAAQEQGDVRELAVTARELRYWSARRASARLIEPELQPQVIRFGVQATLRHDDGSLRVFRIVGEDEADPGAGKLSYVSPIARSLLGAALGERLKVAEREVEITALAGSSAGR